MSALYTVSCPCCFARVYNVHLEAHLKALHARNDQTNPAEPFEPQENR